MTKEPKSAGLLEVDYPGQMSTSEGMNGFEEEPHNLSLFVALIQMYITARREDNLEKAEKLVILAAAKGVKLIILPEYFTCLSTLKKMYEAREFEDGETFSLMSQLAKKYEVFIVAGSIPMKENDVDLPYNTCKVFGPDGKVLCTYKKLHLFIDADVGIGIRICETEIAQQGYDFATFTIGQFKFGIGICSDLMIPEMARIYSEKGCNGIIYLTDFERTEEGPRKWEVLNRARSIDNQMFVMSVSPATTELLKYKSYGYSIAVDPFGTVLCQAGSGEEIKYVTLEHGAVIEARKKIDLNLMRRHDIYKLSYK